MIKIQMNLIKTNKYLNKQKIRLKLTKKYKICNINSNK